MPGGRQAVVALYRINDVAERFGVSKSTLRQWEHHGLITPQRAPSGYRRYSEAELGRIADIVRMRQVEGLNLAAIAAVLKGAETAQAAPGGGETSARPRPQLGRRLRILRQRRGLSLTQAAEQAGISRSALSLIERTSQGASPATIRALAGMYGVTVTDLMASLAGTSVPGVHGRGGRVLPTMGPGLSATQLPTIPNAVMLCQVWTIQPGAGSQGSYNHDGEEFIYVLAGTFEVTLDGEETHTLAQGESIYFESLRHHAWRNPGREETRLLWVNTLPSY
ncbi:MAG: cupin domain-containing protein [bacterium]